MTIIIYLGWLAILWTYTELFARPFDDWKNALLYIGAGLWVITFTLKNKITRPAQPTALLILGCGYVTICALSIIVAPSGKYEGLLELARLILWAGLAWVFAQSTAATWLWLMRITVVSAAAIAALTWLQLQGATFWPYETPWLAPIGHITYYGDFMALSLVMAAGLWGRRVMASGDETTPAAVSPRKRHIAKPQASHDTGMKATVWLGCMALIDIGLALAATRASLAGIVAGLLLAIPLVGYATRSYKKMAVIALIGTINLAVIFYLPMKSMRGGSAGERIRQTASISQTSVEVISSGRWHTYITSARMALERPVLGWGLGTFRFVYPEFAHRAADDSLVSSKVWYMHPHNELLHQAVELGLAGAFLFLLGYLYLLYKGARALGAHPGEDDAASGVLLMTALCGLTVAFVSWQFSTNFLFPVARMLTALLGGIILHAIMRARAEASQTRSCVPLRMTIVGIVSLSTLVLAAYQVSLIGVNQRHKSTSADSVRRSTQWAVWLAPGAFDPLFARAVSAMRTDPALTSAPAVEALHERYPYVPAVLQMMGYLRASQGNIPEARKFLQHALKNDPASAAAKQLLDQLSAPH